MRALDVYLNSELVGSVIENRKGGRFEYEPSIAERHKGSPVLSLSLPAKPKPFGEAKTANWFNGLLPEGPRRDEICKNLNLSPYDWIGLLAEIGWECAGAVQVFSRGEAKNHPPSYRKISETELAESLSDISARLPQKNNATFRMSLGGFQEKLCVCMPKLASNEACIDASEITLPNGSAASTHILKPENEREYPGSAKSEAWAMMAASHAARCSKTALLELAGAPTTLVVERYDRMGGQRPFDVARIHQEDACQALGLNPSEKYANPKETKGSDPTYKAIAELLTKYAKNPEGELAELLRQLTVNLALGNWDAHAKNISFLYEEPQAPTVAPLYDVVPIAEVEPRTSFLSMRVNGRIEPNDVDSGDIVAEAANWGVPSSEAKVLAEECLEHLAEGIRAAGKAYPDAAKRHEAPALERIAKLLQNR